LFILNIVWLTLHGRIGGMQIFIRTIEGVLLTLQVLPKTTIEQVMAMIQAKCEQERVKSRLSYASVTMLEQNTLEHYHVEANSTINENGRLRGGNPDDENMGFSSIGSFSNDEIINEATQRPAVMDHIANQILNNPGAMNKMIAAWTPTLPNIPAIDDKQVAYFMLVRFTPTFQ